MKKTFLTAFAALLMAIPAVQAQKVNKSGLLSKIEKSDADIADAKKNAKASTWINRGKALYEAAVEPTKSLFVNMDAAMLKLAVGEPSATKQVTLLNVPYEAWEYPYFIAYIKDGKVVTWTQTDWVLKEAPAMAIEAYNKAYEIDPKSAAKAKDGLQQIRDFCSQVGNTGIDTGEYVAAADAYATAFQAQSTPLTAQPQTPRCFTMPVTCARWTVRRTPRRSDRVPSTSRKRSTWGIPTRRVTSTTTSSTATTA